MHLLQASAGEISDGSQPLDLQQQPAQLIFISFADSEIALMAQAHAALGKTAPSMRLAQIDWLKHNYSIDHYLQNTALESQMVVARILGGENYWPYGLEQFSARLSDSGRCFVALPGDDRPDENLWRASCGISRADWQALWAYCVEGGLDNAKGFLQNCRSIVENSPDRAQAASPLLRAGLYWPQKGTLDLPQVQEQWDKQAATAAIIFYRAHLQAAATQPIDMLVEIMRKRGFNPLPIYVASLKDPLSAATVEKTLAQSPPAIVINCTGFAHARPQSQFEPYQGNCLDAAGMPIIQAILAGVSEEQWQSNKRGLSPRDLAMNVALPEIDGRLISRAIAFKSESYFDGASQCPIVSWQARSDRVQFVADLAHNWHLLAKAPAAKRKLALILANYPNRDGRLANGVGLDVPASCINIMRALRKAGYDIADMPQDADALMRILRTGPTNDLRGRRQRQGGERLSLVEYQEYWQQLPQELREAVQDRWGAAADDPYCENGEFVLAIHRFGKIIIGIQPSRGYNIDPEKSYHCPDLLPPHYYFAFYLWLRKKLAAQAIVQIGKHGNLEWLPGKSIALSQECLPEAVLGPMPHIYPFIVNNPGEGTQAKRRTQAVIVDHLTPPMARAGLYGELLRLEALMDEYYEAVDLDPSRVSLLREQIGDEMIACGIDREISGDGRDGEDRLQALDAYLCELKESQIRDGLHIFGDIPFDGSLHDLALALVHIPRNQGQGRDASLIRALALDLDILADDFDPIDCDMGKKWQGKKPDILADLTKDAWRSNGDTVERLQMLALKLISGELALPANWQHSQPVLQMLDEHLLPMIKQSAQKEMAGLLQALAGRFVEPGPAGAPTRGRLDVLPTGRNFYSVDCRALPTQAAWHLGWRSASLLIERYVREEGDWPKSIALSAWGTANMRTGGDDIAQALALMGVRPKWEQASRRVVGFEIIPLDALSRPRVDVTLRISGFFRDAFPAQIELIDSAARAVMQLDEPEDMNPLMRHFKRDVAGYVKQGANSTEAGYRAGFRVFGSKPGAYGAGLQTLIDEHIWQERSDFAKNYLSWGGYAYGSQAQGEEAKALLAERLCEVQIVLQNQDNREHDILDADDYYQFAGGLAATVEHLRGEAAKSYHVDSSNPESPHVRTLQEEISRVMRSRAVNPKWIKGVMRHGYKGGFEIAATVDYLFAFAATTNEVADRHFDMAYAAYLHDEKVRDFLQKHNPAALAEIAARLQEAITRQLWKPRSNSARAQIESLVNSGDNESLSTQPDSRKI